jgi:hypothetical protein
MRTDGYYPRLHVIGKSCARVQIEQMLVLAGFERTRFSDFRRFTCAASESPRNTGS